MIREEKRNYIEMCVRNTLATFVYAIEWDELEREFLAMFRNDMLTWEEYAEASLLISLVLDSLEEC